MAAQHDELATKRDLDQLKQELSAKIYGNSAKIEANGGKIEANGKKIDANGAKIDANGVKIDEVERNLSAKIDANAASIHKLTVQVTKNGEAIEKTLTREEYKKDYNELLRELDGMMVVLVRVDQERVATTARMDRIEHDVQKLKAR